MYLSTTWLQPLSVVKVTNSIVSLLLVVALIVCGDLCSVLIFMFYLVHAQIQNQKNIRVPSNVGYNPRKSRKLPSKHSLLGHHRHASETQFKWS